MSRQRLNAKEAAEVLGISVDAVRMRARRGTLEGEHDENGRLYVWVNTDETTDEPRSDTTALISAKDDLIETLRDQLEAERQAHSESRRLLAAALERIPAIESPREPQNEPESAESRSNRVETPEEPERATERRTWWRRVWGK